MVDLTEYKSLEIVKDPSKIATSLQKSQERSLKSAPSGTFLVRNSDGRTMVTKQTAMVLPTDFAMPSATDLSEMATKLGIGWEDGMENRCLPFWGSDERVDRHGDIVEQSWNFDNYANNPLLLYSHDWELPPIGNVIDWQVVHRGDDGYNGDALRLLCLFADATVWEWADTVYRLTKAGVMKTGSVGFYPGEVVYVKDQAERAKLGLGDYGCVYRNNELLEYSPTSVPANAGAHRIMTSAKSAGVLRAGDIQALREIKRREFMSRKAGNKEWKNADATFITFWKSFFPAVKVAPTDDLETPILLAEFSEGVPPVSSKTGQQKQDEGDDVQPSVLDMLSEMNGRLQEVHDHVTGHTATLDDLMDIMRTPDDEEPSDDDDDTSASANPMDFILSGEFHS